MKFLALIFTLAATVVADSPLGGHKYPLPSDLTVGEAQAACGDKAQLSCCNKASYAGDTTHAGGLVSNVLGAGSAAEGAGIFDQCSKLDVQIPLLLILGINDVLDQQCKQNVACCQDSGDSASEDGIGAGLPCVALGSII